MSLRSSAGAVRPERLALSLSPGTQLGPRRLARPTAPYKRARIIADADVALEQLSSTCPRAARVVHLRYLCGLTLEDVAAELGLSPGTVKRGPSHARWLASALQK